jgi:malonyl CoA-acyl carrier protein transacylase
MEKAAKEAKQDAPLEAQVAASKEDAEGFSSPDAFVPEEGKDLPSILSEKFTAPNINLLSARVSLPLAFIFSLAAGSAVTR